MARNTCPTCGASKDKRAAECGSCGHSRKAVKQWNNPESRKRTYDAISAKAKTRRRLFEHISLETKWMHKDDGRAYTYYWEGDKKRYIYRYQWVWICANGPIPDGYSIHHRNHIKTDDRIENLEEMPRGEYSRLHEPETRALSILARGEQPISEDERYRVCETCGKTFAIKLRAKSNRFCSLPCYWQSMRAC